MTIQWVCTHLCVLVHLRTKCQNLYFSPGHIFAQENVATLPGSFGRRTDPRANPQADPQDLTSKNHKAFNKVQFPSCSSLWQAMTYPDILWLKKISCVMKSPNSYLGQGTDIFSFPTWTGRWRREKVFRERHFTGHENVGLPGCRPGLHFLCWQGCWQVMRFLLLTVITIGWIYELMTTDISLKEECF